MKGSRGGHGCWVLGVYYCAIAISLLVGVSGEYGGGKRAFFVFGDSLVDSGNNNFLATTARADAPPYGIDYPTRRATGRFSNGLNIPDLISTYTYNNIYK